MDWQALARGAVQELLQPVRVGRKRLTDASMQDVIKRLSQQGEAGLPHALALADAIAVQVNNTHYWPSTANICTVARVHVAFASCYRASQKAY